MPYFVLFLYHEFGSFGLILDSNYKFGLCNVTVTGFLSCWQRQLEHWAHGIKDTEMLDILDGVDIY